MVALEGGGVGSGGGRRYRRRGDGRRGWGVAALEVEEWA